MEKKFSKNLTIPNILSLLRILILVPFVIYVSNNNYILSGVILIISGLTDLLDGFIARKFGQVTHLGEMLDPAADKLTLMTVMICVSIKFPKIFPFMMLLIVKEVSMLIAGFALLKFGKKPTASKWYGKLSTVVFYVSIIIIIGVKAIWNVDIEFLDILLMSVTSFCMIYSLGRYFKIFISLMREK